MKKIAVLTAALALLVATSAQAKDLGGKFGIGYEATLGGVQGLAISYFVTNALAIDVDLGLRFASPDSGDSLFGFNAIVGARYNFARAKDTNLGIGLRVDLGFLNKAANGGADSTFQANIELPLLLEHFFGEHFAIMLGFGITIDIHPEKGDALSAAGGNKIFGLDPGAKGFGLSFFNGGLFGNAGFRFYF